MTRNPVSRRIGSWTTAAEWRNEPKHSALAARSTAIRRAARAFAAAFIAAVSASAAPALADPVLSTLYRFPGGTNGNFPRSGLAMDASGDLYGATQYDGSCSTCGVIYKLVHPTAGSAWTYQLLHQFTLGSDGIRPVAPLTYFQNAVYGVASAGGDPTCGCGIVFKITTGGAYTNLHTFGPFVPGGGLSQWPNGTTPIGGLLIDTDGTIYGTTNSGGTGTPGPDSSNGAGIIYKISGATFSKIHDFDGSLNAGPQGELIFGQDGAIYGTQFGGGQYNQGAIFRINKDGSNYTVLYSFKGVNQPGGSTDGANPEGRLAVGPDGTIYGTTTFGGSPSGYGTAWSIKNVGGTWTYKQLYIFGSPGNLPHSGLIRWADGALYGTGAGGGAYQEGVIYRLLPPVSGSAWTYQLLHSFKGLDPDGNIPYGDLLYVNSTFYGVNTSGGSLTGGTGYGTVFQFTLGASHDFNGDGKSDILWRHSAGSAAVWLMNGTAIATSAGIGAADTSWRVFGQGDFDGNGKSDVLWRHTGGSVALWLMNGTSIVTSMGIGAADTAWTIAGVGDFNGDGKSDILWRHSGGSVALWLMNGTTVSSSTGIGAADTSWTIARIGDLNGDGRSDILWRHSGGSVAVWLMNGTSIGTSTGIGAADMSWTIARTGDFNGDGKSDILWRHSGGSVAVWLMNGTTIATSAGVGAADTSWTIAGSGDVNGDGRSDVLWRHTAGSVAIWVMNGTAITLSGGLGVADPAWVIQGVNAN